MVIITQNKNIMIKNIPISKKNTKTENAEQIPLTTFSSPWEDTI